MNCRIIHTYVLGVLALGSYEALLVFFYRYRYESLTSRKTLNTYEFGPWVHRAVRAYRDHVITHGFPLSIDVDLVVARYNPSQFFPKCTAVHIWQWGFVGAAETSQHIFSTPTEYAQSLSLARNASDFAVFRLLPTPAYL